MIKRFENYLGAVVKRRKGGGSPAEQDALLLESGDNLLLESGDNLLIE